MAYDNEIRNTIQGDSLEDCKKVLFEKYGPNYKIIDQQSVLVSYGLFRLRKKYVKEVTYTVDYGNSYNESAEYKKEAETLERNRQALLINTQMSQVSNQMAQQIQELKNEMSAKLSEIAVNSQEKHESIKKIEDMLEQNEFTYSFIELIEEKIRNDFSLDQLDNFELVERRVIDWIGETINIAKEKVYRPPHVVIIVGPTGVGKTTTLVKLAAQYVIGCKHEGRKAEICFITTDSMRVGAMEQLSRFGQILNYKVLKAENAEDLKTLYDENRDLMDAIFIDTSGYSPNDSTHIGALKALLDIPGMNPDIYLAMTASTKARDLSNIMKNYEPFGYNSVIITKCDESDQYGNVISMLYDKRKAISYITNGQIASKNIQKASVVDFLIRLEGFKVDRIHIEDKFGEK